MSDADKILKALAAGDDASAERLLSLVYDELHRMASAKMRHEAAGVTLQPTALVHEAWLRLIGPDSESTPQWNSRGHFFSAAAEAMRRILVDAARKRNALKRGGGLVRLDFEESAVGVPTSDADILALHDVVDRLEVVDPSAAQIVKLRFFAGLTMSEAAAAMQISVRSAHDVWKYARAWLRQQLRPE